MNYPEIGQTVEIHSYKHNSKIHRIWHETTILDISDEVVIGANNKTLVMEADGRTWYTREPAVCYFYTQYWFNVLCMLRKDGVYFYCNLSSPFVYDQQTIKYIDYDLDLKLFPDKSILELDKKEYLYHKEKYHYSDDLDKVVNHEFNRIKKLMKQNVFPFIDKKIFDYINIYYKIKKEQDEIY